MNQKLGPLATNKLLCSWFDWSCYLQNYWKGSNPKHARNSYGASPYKISESRESSHLQRLGQKGCCRDWEKTETALFQRIQRMDWSQRSIFLRERRNRKICTFTSKFSTLYFSDPVRLLSLAITMKSITKESNFTFPIKFCSVKGRIAASILSLYCVISCNWGRRKNEQSVPGKKQNSLYCVTAVILLFHTNPRNSKSTCTVKETEKKSRKRTSKLVNSRTHIW